MNDAAAFINNINKDKAFGIGFDFQKADDRYLEVLCHILNLISYKNIVFLKLDFRKN